MSQLSIEIPESAFRSLKIPEDQWQFFIRSTVAISLYRDGLISLGKAKEIAGLENKWEMIQLLSQRGVDLHYTARDAEKDRDTLNRVLA